MVTGGEIIKAAVFKKVVIIVEKCQIRLLSIDTIKLNAIFYTSTSIVSIQHVLLA